MNMYPWYRDSVGGQLGQLCGPMATTIKTENGYNDCMLALDYATQSKKAFGWDGTQSGGSPSGPQSGAVGGQGAQGLVHWMSVMAEHMDPAVSHYMSWNQEQCGQHGKDDYPNWTRNTMGINKQGYESKMNEHNQMQKVYAGMEDHHMTGTPGLYTSGRSTSSSSSPGVAGSSPALLVVPQPINATKMGGMQNGGPQPRKYQCKMCPQGRLEYRTGGLDFHQPPMLLENNANYSHLQRSIDTLRSLGDRLGDRNVDLRLNLHQDLRTNDRLTDRNLNLNDRNNQTGLPNSLELNLSLNSDRLLQERMQQERNLERLINERNMQEQRMNLDHSLSLERLNLERSLTQNLDRTLSDRNLNIPQNTDRSLIERMNSERGLIDRNLNSERSLLDRNVNSEQRSSSGGGGSNGGGGGNNTTTNALMDRNLNSDRNVLDRNLNNVDRGFGTDRLTERLRMDPVGDMRHNSSDINDLKYREYKAHLENLRSESSRSLEGRAAVDEDRGTTPSTPPTPISVGENFQEEKVFGSKAELQLHTQAHMREAKPYKCSQCCKAFANSSYLSQHTRIHLGIKPYRCEICQRKFTQLSHLQQHIRTHTGDKPYNSSLSQHTRSHLGNKPYRCEICQRKFTQLSHLQQHVRTHTGDKPYKCRHPGCQKAFSQLSNLQSHSRCHQTDKPYKCNSCYKCFSDEPSLLEHIPKHKESKHLKTHICQYCGKSYTQETYLSKHMQKHAERTDKRPPIGPGLGLNHRGLDHPYWPKVSPDSAENMHDYPNDIPRQILEQNEDLVIIRQQLSQNPPAPPGTPNANLANSYDTSISKSNTNSAFTPINSMSGHLNLNHHQLAPNRPYIYDALNFQKQNSLDIPKSQPSNGFPNQLISLHQIRNYAHQPNSSLMEHSILGGLKDK